MALDTKYGNSGEGDHLLVIRTVGTVATQAVHVHVRVSLVLELVTDRMSGMRLPVMAGSAQIDDGRLLGQEIIVRSVWVMTSGAGPLIHRFMLGWGQLLPTQGIGVALAADLDLGTRKQIFPFRSVGGMALEATALAYQGPVHTIFAEEIIHHIVMAALAELVARSFEFERVG